MWGNPNRKVGLAVKPGHRRPGQVARSISSQSRREHPGPSVGRTGRSPGSRLRFAIRVIPRDNNPAQEMGSSHLLTCPTSLIRMQLGKLESRQCPLWTSRRVERRSPIQASARECPASDKPSTTPIQDRAAFHRTNPAKPPDCRRSRPNQHGHPAAASQFVGSTRPRVSFEQSTRSFPGIDRYVREKSAGPGRWLVDLQRSSSHRTEPALHYNLHRKVES